jgi:hypothetical protein
VPDAIEGHLQTEQPVAGGMRRPVPTRFDQALLLFLARDKPKLTRCCPEECDCQSPGIEWAFIAGWNAACLAVSESMEAAEIALLGIGRTSKEGK